MAARWVLGVSLAVLGCGKSSSHAPPARAVAADAAPADAAPADAAPADAAGPIAATPAQVAAARAFVEAWQATQNDGDFPGYQELYAARFTGIRRSGAVTRRFDRPGWMKDRRKMFARPMQVEIADVVVYVAGAQRQVFFTQTWTQGRWRDTGTKNLVLVGDGLGTRIAFEEMLGSRVVDPLPTAALLADGRSDTWFGYDRAASLAAMRLAPVVDGLVVLGGTDRAMPAIDLRVVTSVVDAAAGGVGAARVRGALGDAEPLRAIAAAPVVVLHDDLTEACAGTVTVTAVETSAYLARALAEDDPGLPAAVWAERPYLILAELTAPCAGGFVRSVDATPVVAVPDQRALPAKVAARAARGLAVDGAAAEVAATVDDGRAGFALITVERDDSCAAPALHERALLTATQAGRWSPTVVARIDGVAAGLLVADLDGDDQLDAIVDGGVYRGGRFELWWPELVIPWPAGLGCDGDDDE
ncbi:MAG: DUF4440 domain-containing protein [Kofleriaceae bacterium]